MARRRRRKRPKSTSSITRRAALLLVASGSAVGLRSTGGYNVIESPRSTRASVASDNEALLKLGGFDSSKIYEEPHEVTVTNLTDSTLENNVAKTTGDLVLRDPSTSSSSQRFSIEKLDPGQDDSFEVVTASGRSGKVTDTISLSVSSSDGISIETERDITVKFKSGAQLVYAVSKGDIRVYDAVNDTERDPGQSIGGGPIEADVIGANVADIVGDSNADIPYLNKSEDPVYATSVGGGSAMPIQKGKKPKLKKQKTRIALREWPPANLSGSLILSADNNSSRIIAIDSNGNDEVIASPPNGCGGVAGIADIDCDGNEEMVFVDSSQQIRYLNQDETVTKVPNGGVGSNNSTGFGPPADLDGDGIPEIPFIDGSQNPALITAGGSKTLLNSSSIAKKAAIAPVDIDGDGALELMFLGNSSGKIKYIDDVGGANTVKTLTVDGNHVKPLEKIGLNSGVNPDEQLSSDACS